MAYIDTQIWLPFKRGISVTSQHVFRYSFNAQDLKYHCLDVALVCVNKLKLLNFIQILIFLFVHMIIWVLKALNYSNQCVI